MDHDRTLIVAGYEPAVILIVIDVTRHPQSRKTQPPNARKKTTNRPLAEQPNFCRRPGPAPQAAVLQSTGHLPTIDAAERITRWFPPACHAGSGAEMDAASH